MYQRNKIFFVSLIDDNNIRQCNWPALGKLFNFSSVALFCFCFCQGAHSTCSKACMPRLWRSVHRDNNQRIAEFFFEYLIFVPAV